jgi:hypothetical protein
VPFSPLAFRTLTFVAAGFLTLDGAMLMGLGVWTGRRTFLLAGALTLLSAGLVLLLWRRHLRRPEAIDEARRDLREEAEELRRLLRR